MSSKVINFSDHLKKKQDRAALKERIAISGWDIDNEVKGLDSEVCIYLIDSKEDGVILFGLKKADFPASDSEEVIHWGHFVLAWDVIADPKMAFDDTHKKVTMDFAVKALPSLSEWSSFAERAFDTAPDHKAHILVIIDRKNLDNPLELIVAHSTAPIMNPESIQSIVDSYINSDG